ncbi:MAG: tRNA (adenosine(37)-N6)-dimethylallyltransferase MiaA [Porphyromonas sp.]|nr:tRNA (adenosine(37)-N6)-dimethylallyltransferase MiaA [Porphyromonas sp.]
MRLPVGIDLITIYGPTATGKTAVAVALAKKTGAVILSGDSRQVYRGMDIGTGKDLSEYNTPEGAVPYRLIDIADAGERYNLHRYVEDFFEAYEALPPETPKILCGGTGLYMTAVIGGYDMPRVPEDPSLRRELERLSTEELQERLAKMGGDLSAIDIHNPRRLVRAIELMTAERAGTVTPVRRAPLRGPIFCLDVDREVRRARISKRLEARLREGMVEEVEGLMQKVDPEVLIGYGLEYRFVTEYLLGHLTYDEMHDRLEIAIHQFAKRQMTWARGMERKGFKIQYIHPHAAPEETAEAMYDYIINNYQ